MGKVKNTIIELSNLVADYIWRMNTIDNLDKFIKEQKLDLFTFYIENKELIIETAFEVLNLDK